MCLAHTAPGQRELALAMVHAGADINLTRGVPFAAELLAEILKIVPETDGRRTLANPDFTLASFKGDASFREVRFIGFTSFENAVFSGDVSFERATFNNDVSFEHASFNGDARFDEARFNGGGLFREATFGEVWFLGTRFSGDASFDGASFSGRVILAAAFEGNASFARTLSSEDGTLEARRRPNPKALALALMAVAGLVVTAASWWWPRGPSLLMSGDVLRGNGGERTQGSGSYGEFPFEARSALLFTDEYSVKLRIFSRRYNCRNSWRADLQKGLGSVEAEVVNDSARLLQLPLDEPRSVPVAFEVSPQRNLNGKSWSDPAEGLLTLTRIDTSLGGTWHGALEVPTSPSRFSPQSKSLSATFAARWCGA